MDSLSFSSILKSPDSPARPRPVEKDHRESLYMELLLESVDFQRGAITPSVQRNKQSESDQVKTQTASSYFYP